MSRPARETLLALLQGHRYDLQRGVDLSRKQHLYWRISGRESDWVYQISARPDENTGRPDEYRLDDPSPRQSADECLGRPSCTLLRRSQNWLSGVLEFCVWKKTARQHRG